MNLLDRFSTHLREVLTKSIQLATELKNSTVEPVHVLFALTVAKGSVAAEIMHRFKIDSKTIEKAIFALPITRNQIATTKNATDQKTITPFSGTTKNVLEKAILTAQEHHHNYIGTEHLLSALIAVGGEGIIAVFKETGANIDEFEQQITAVLSNSTQFAHMNEVAETIEHIQETIADEMHTGHNHPPASNTPPTEGNKHEHKKTPSKKESALEFFATELTAPNIQSTLDPLIGRDQELERVIQILCRRTKNNPILLGDPGVGKTAIVEGLAKKIVAGEVPDLLLNKKIFALDMGLLIAGTIYRGEFEARLRQVMEEIANDSNIILFIDEIHNIVGAGSNQGTMDAANILKPVLARGQLRCIGSTTPGEFKKYIESDPALERRFLPVMVKEPNNEDTVKILTGIKKNYEQFHRVHITLEAIEAAVELSSRYITSKFLPDKAIDLLDETAAAKRLRAKSSAYEHKLERLKRDLEKTILEKEAAAGSDQFDTAVGLKQKEEKLRLAIDEYTARASKKTPKMVGTITAADIAEQMARTIGATPTELMLREKQSVNSLIASLRTRIVGQDEVITQVSNRVRQAQLGLSNPNRPLASFLFVGDSGVGKTELARTLAHSLYPHDDALIRLDMSEFNEGFSTSKLLGSPAGYIGYKESNQFTDRLKMNPHAVVLFDEVDKAHRDVLKLLLQILESGEITDATGKKISLRQAVIILTTSLGSEETKRGSFGFNHAVEAKDTRARITEKLKQFFTPELYNRIDQICIFSPLTPDHLTDIALLELTQLNQQLTRYHTKLETQKKTLAEFIASAPEQLNNARDVRSRIRLEVERLMTKIILAERVKRTYQLHVDEGKMAVR